MKKKIFFTSLLALSLLLCAACGGSGEQSSSQEEQSNQSVESIQSSNVESAETLESSEEAESSVIAKSSEVIESSEEVESSEIIESPEETESSDEASSEEIESVEGYFCVTFDSDGGTVVEAVQVKEGEKITKPQNPQKINTQQEYEFLGWYYGDTAWDFDNDVVTQNMTLVARWKLVDTFTKPFLPKD